MVRSESKRSPKALLIVSKIIEEMLVIKMCG